MEAGKNWEGLGISPKNIPNSRDASKLQISKNHFKFEPCIPINDPEAFFGKFQWERGTWGNTTKGGNPKPVSSETRNSIKNRVEWGTGIAFAIFRPIGNLRTTSATLSGFSRILTGPYIKTQ